ncbi:MAG: DUF4231 domain-containing protein [Caulobacteraceae bacterium]
MATGEQGGSSDDGAGAGRLPLVLTVGFAGHRAVGDDGHTAGLLDRAFAVVGAAFAALPEVRLDCEDERLGEAYDGAPRSRLLSGDAPGADRLAIARWRAAGLGEVRVLYPFRDHDTGGALTDDPEHAGPDDRVGDLGEFPCWTGLDPPGVGLARNQAHAEIGRWVVRHCDVLVAVWNGQAAVGPGGTADTVRRALERGLPVVWLTPGEDEISLIEPHAFARRSEISEAMADPAQIAEPLSASALTATLVGVFAPPCGRHGGQSDPEVAARRDYAHVDPLQPKGVGRVFDGLLDRTVWRAFRAFKNSAGDLRRWKPPGGAAAPRPEDLADMAGFLHIQSAFDEADRRANHLSDIHRSQQLLLIVIAIAAVLIGALPALAGRDPTHRVHVIAAAGEFVLGGVALLLTYFASRAHRHRRWSDARRLAERLRAACATWPLGADLADAHLRRAPTWTEWRARAVLRAAGPPTGWLGREELDERAAWAASELIGGQIGYHAKEHHAAEHIERWIKRVEGSAFLILMAALAAFLLGTWVLPRFGWTMAGWVGGVVVVISAVSPALGAAGLALEATNGFGDLALRSVRLQREFEQLRGELGEIKHPSLHHMQEVLRTAAQLLVEDADSWRDRLVSRRIVRGG